MRLHTIIAAASCAVWLGPAHGQGVVKPLTAPIGKTPVPLGPLVPGKPPLVDPHALQEAINAQPTTALSDILGQPIVDQPNRLSWIADRAGELDVKIGDTFELAYLTRGKPAYDRVKLQFKADIDHLDAGSGCGNLAEKRVATVDGQIKAEPAPDDAVKAVVTPKNKLDGKGDIFLVRVTAAFDDDLLVAAKLKQKAAVRAFPTDAKGACLQASAGAYLATLVDEASMPKITLAPPKKPPPEPPHVGVNWDVVGYYPRIDNDISCDYIITDKVSDPTWKAVLHAANISTAVGTHFGLCEGDFHRLYDELPESEKIGIALKDVLSDFTHAYNWTTGEFQKLAADLAGPASAILHSKKLGLIVTEALMGALPDSPLTGDLNMSVDLGCGYLKQQVGAKLASGQNTEKLSPEEQKQSDDVVQQVCNAVKSQLQERGRPNKFLVHDPALASRAPIAFVRVKYTAVNDPPPDASSAPIPLKIAAQSRGGPGPISPMGAPRIVLLQRDVVIPPGKAGTSIIIPYMLDYAIPPDSTAAADSGRAEKGIDLITNYPAGPTLVLKSIIAKVEPPAH